MWTLSSLAFGILSAWLLNWLYVLHYSLTSNSVLSNHSHITFKLVLILLESLHSVIRLCWSVNFQCSALLQCSATTGIYCLPCRNHWPTEEKQLVNVCKFMTLSCMPVVDSDGLNWIVNHNELTGVAMRQAISRHILVAPPAIRSHCSDQDNH